MTRAASGSWRIGIDFDRRGASLLYVRDVAGLHGPEDYAVPPLTPAVELRADLAPYATAAAAEQWSRWWFGHLAALRHPAQFGPEAAPPPEPGTDLRALYERVVADAGSWVRERKQEFVVRSIGPGSRKWRMQPQETVSRIERELGRESAPFSLTVRLLPLERKWGRRIDGDLLAASELLWQDPDSCDLFLDPVVRSLA
jgi:hypothetical protein